MESKHYGACACICARLIESTIMESKTFSESTVVEESIHYGVKTLCCLCQCVIFWIYHWWLTTKSRVLSLQWRHKDTRTATNQHLQWGHKKSNLSAFRTQQMSNTILNRYCEQMSNEIMREQVKSKRVYHIVNRCLMRVYPSEVKYARTSVKSKKV